MPRIPNGDALAEQDSSIKRASSTSSHYDNINANLHARVKAFQEQRALKRSASVGSTSSGKSTNTTNSNNSNNESTNTNDNKSNEKILSSSNHKSRSHLKTQSATLETLTTTNTSINSNIGKNATISDQPSSSSSTTIAAAASVSSNTSQNKHVSIVNKPLPPLPPIQNNNRNNNSNNNDNSSANTSVSSKNNNNNDNNNNNSNNNNNNNNNSITKDLNNLTIGENKTIPKPINKVTINTNLSRTPNTSPMMNNLGPNQFNPNRRAPRRPVVITGSNSISNSSNNTAAQNRQPKLSLSARRGLKLPPGGMSLKNLTKSSSSSSSSSNSNALQEFEGSPTNETAARRPNHGSLINGIQRTSISSNDKTRGSNNNSNTVTADGSGSSSSGGSGSGSGGLFSIFSKYVDIKSGSLNFAGKLSLSSTGIDFSNGSSSRITLDELEFIEELGHGNYGNVSKVLHKPTNVIMAMKEVKLELDEAKFKQILMELEILHKCQSPYIVDFYGAFFIEGAVYMCMEYMDGGSLDKIYDPNPEIGGIDEPQLAYISNAVIRGLKVLKDVHNIIHRDVKPTNILCSAKQGTIKLCDFGVSGNLVASMAKTNIGCQSYMAPERIKSLNPDIATYTVQSDIWSLGLSILEMALGRYPYPPETFDNIFSQLSAIVDGPAPKLPSDRFSSEAQDFVSLCLQKIPERRPNYASLIEHPWLVKYRDVDVGMSEYITTRLQKRKAILAERGENGLPKVVPALHMGGLP
ncbi:similar to Saccharomyces cerevisiae YJL128C PBS2 MAP kinase kinase of the HOG signaling pathway [Maudiozyma saulgeensis]|uniref:mitogen-activated protein kinase kinase n=1 Tax=Maudiozyma saulgeensis TaxID=1789683 RepID=A0A1X7RBI8_9SACH|nr:similar to Saccharomyces cerevisiae YJL128C PBS2 MAP kinase kinase of the HOG signaling pathway [Kazachstania saulgeensis]